ncbi:MAG: MMPL family transporter [Gammaproteobacteria bacterium]|nr:MMPL family transporter [Gammaproteobacteria bacterium]
MGNFIERRLEALIGHLVQASVRHRWLVIAAMLCATVAAAGYTVRHVAINTDTADMLSAELPWRKAYAAYKEAFPYFADTLVVVVDARTPDLARESATALARALAADDAHFDDVFDPASTPFFRREQLLYLDPARLEGLLDDLAGAQALLARLADDPGLNGFLTLLDDVAAHGDDAPARLDTVLGSVTAAVDGFLAGDPVPMSWQRLVAGADEPGATRVVFTAQPRLDYTSLLPAATAIEALRATAARLGLDPAHGVTVRLTGGAALGYDELRSVMSGAEQAGLLSLVMVALCLVLGLRSLSLVAATLLALVAGLSFTACFATLAVGTLNMISVAFAVLYVGLGVDFAIHVCLRYRELCNGRSQRDALLGATRHVGVSLALCALTTAIGFLAFLPTSYRGVAELGLISGVGIVIGLVISLSLLPALLDVLPAPRPPAPSRTAHLLERVADPRRKHHVLGIAAMAALLAAAALPFARFDYNPLHLNDPAAESVRTFQDLDQDGAMYSIAMVAPDEAAADTLATRLRALPEVGGVTTPDDLVPGDQNTKLDLIDTLRLTLGSVPVARPASPLDARAVATSLARLAGDLRAAPGDTARRQAAAALAMALDRVRTHLTTLDTSTAASWLAALQDKLLHHFPAQLDQLADALDAQPFAFDDLPAALRARWKTADGRARLDITPAADLDDNTNLARFVAAVRSITGPSATGTPVINIEASRAVTTAFYEAFGAAGVLIAALLYVILRRIGEVVIVLTPLLLAGLLTTAITVVADVPFNFANIIALPLLLGIGVDSALHIMHRYKTTGEDDVSLLASSSARAVLFSALTTAASFGNLATSPHAGTASMGVMLTIGLTMTLLCTLIVLPALLRRYVQPTGSLT